MSTGFNIGNAAHRHPIARPRTPEDSAAAMPCISCMVTQRYHLRLVYMQQIFFGGVCGCVAIIVFWAAMGYPVGWANLAGLSCTGWALAHSVRSYWRVRWAESYLADRIAFHLQDRYGEVLGRELLCEIDTSAQEHLAGPLRHALGDALASPQSLRHVDA